jgi:hypothetical protein
VANNIVLAEASRVLDASLGTATFTAPTGPMKLALETVTGTNAAAGTEVTGGSYARQAITFTAASSGSTSNSNTITFTAMPAATVTGLEIYDSAGSPRRAWVGALSASKTMGAGDTLSFPTASIAITLQ